MLSMFIGICFLVMIYGSLAVWVATEPALWERPAYKRRYVMAPRIIIRPDPAHVRPVGAPERVAFPRRTTSGRGTL